MDKLQELKAERTRLEMELLTLAEGSYRNDVLIDIATIENEIADQEYLRIWKHNHVPAVA